MASRDIAARRRRKARRKIILLASALILPTAGVVLCVLLAQSQVARESCANCRSFIPFCLTSYAEANEGRLPRGGRDDLDSLAKCIRSVEEVHFFTTHALASKARACWKEKGTLTEGSCCYRYNEGLRADDPAGLVVMYYRAPTHWECSSHKMPERGRPCMVSEGLTWSWLWRWMTEAEFQSAQAKTLAYLRDREVRRADIEKVRSWLRLVVSHSTPEPNTYQFQFRLENRGDTPIDVTHLESFCLERSGGGGTGGGPGLGEPAERFLLPPGGAHTAQEGLTIEIEDTWPDGQKRQRQIRGTTPGGHFSGTMAWEGDAGLLDRECWVEMRARVRVRTEGMRDLDIAISGRDRYLLPDAGKRAR